MKKTKKIIEFKTFSGIIDVPTFINSIYKIFYIRNNIMEIRARPKYRNTGNNHTLVDGLINHESKDNGSIDISVDSKEINLSGNFSIKIKISKEEVESLYRSSVQAPISSRLKKLENEVRELSHKNR